MNVALHDWGFFRPLTWEHVLTAVLVLLAARLLSLGLGAALRRSAERARPSVRLPVLRLIPITRTVIAMVAVLIVIPILVDPTLRNVLALVAAVGLGVAFTLKDFASSLAAGIVATLENAYQPGDWIELDGTYGEVKAIGTRAVRIVTPSDNEVVIPHSFLWGHKVSNATSGSRSLLCIADFYLHPDHDAAAASAALKAVAGTSAWHKADSAVSVIVQEEPWGTHYKLKAYVKESREQFAFITDLTIEGKATLRQMGVRFAVVPAMPHP